MADGGTVIEQIRVMLEMQDEMNRHIDADWLSRDREWYRAIWIECAELMDHYGGWKWWKHASPDHAQALLEIVDIWHFGLSMSIDEARDHRNAAAKLAAQWDAPPPARPFLEEVERLAMAALAERRFDVGATRNLLAGIGRGFEDLFRCYIGKNVLNVFRQDHGYRDGTYLKHWHGREDNEVLHELIGTLDAGAADFSKAVYDGLAARYASVRPA